MFGRREPRDPWHTVLYKDPARLWWLPGLLAGLAYAAASALAGQDLRPRHVVTGLLVSAVVLAIGGVSFRRDRRR
jgi:hypothetical protein